MNDGCGHSVARWEPAPRCTQCGHRRAEPGEGWVPEQTRHLPVIYWPFELYARFLARRLGRRRFSERRPSPEPGERV